MFPESEQYTQYIYTITDTNKKIINNIKIAYNDQVVWPFISVTGTRASVLVVLGLCLFPGVLWQRRWGDPKVFFFFYVFLVLTLTSSLTVSKLRSSLIPLLRLYYNVSTIVLGSFNWNLFKKYRFFRENALHNYIRYVLSYLYYCLIRKKLVL